MLDKIIELDRELLVFLNNLGSLKYDFFWVLFTQQMYWIPFFLLVFYLIIQKKGLKNTLIILVFVAILVFVGDQITNLVKNIVQRVRPCNDIDLMNIIRVRHRTLTYSFFSGHATNSMAVTLFVFLIIKKYFKYTWLLFIWPLIFAYSRIYVGVHFPLDIITGYCVGATLGYTCYKGYNFVLQKYYPEFL